MSFSLHFYFLLHRVSHLSRGVSPAVEAMADVTPGVAFDLSVKRESRAFIGSILDADVSSRLDFTLKPNVHVVSGRTTEERSK